MDPARVAGTGTHLGQGAVTVEVALMGRSVPSLCYGTGTIWDTQGAGTGPCPHYLWDRNVRERGRTELSQCPHTDLGDRDRIEGRDPGESRNLGEECRKGLSPSGEQGPWRTGIGHSCPPDPTLICGAGSPGKSRVPGEERQERDVPMSLQWSTGTRGGLRPWEWAKAGLSPWPSNGEPGTRGRAETLGMGQVRVVPMSLHWRTGTRGRLGFWEGVRT